MSRKWVKPWNHALALGHSESRHVTSHLPISECLPGEEAHGKYQWLSTQNPMPSSLKLLGNRRTALWLKQSLFTKKKRPRLLEESCNGHYNRTPDLGKCVMWWNTWDLARHTILDTKVLDRNVTWLTKHKDTSWHEHKVRRHLAPLVVVNTDKASWQANDRRRVRNRSDLKKTKMAILGLRTSP